MYGLILSSRIERREFDGTIPLKTWTDECMESSFSSESRRAFFVVLPLLWLEMAVELWRSYRIQMCITLCTSTCHRWVKNRLLQSHSYCWDWRCKQGFRRVLVNESLLESLELHWRTRWNSEQKCRMRTHFLNERCESKQTETRRSKSKARSGNSIRMRCSAEFLILVE